MACGGRRVSTWDRCLLSQVLTYFPRCLLSLATSLSAATSTVPKVLTLGIPQPVHPLPHCTAALEICRPPSSLSSLPVFRAYPLCLSSRLCSVRVLRRQQVQLRVRPWQPPAGPAHPWLQSSPGALPRPLPPPYRHRPQRMNSQLQPQPKPPPQRHLQHQHKETPHTFGSRS